MDLFLCLLPRAFSCEISYSLRDGFEASFRCVCFFGGIASSIALWKRPLCTAASGSVLWHCRQTGHARAGDCKDEHLLIPFLVAVSHIPLPSLARWQPHCPCCSSSKPRAGAAWVIPPASGWDLGLRHLDKRGQGHGIWSRSVTIGIPSPIPISTCAAQR